MHKLLRKILEILDGTPAIYGKRQRGQSVVEMAFITPLLIILIMGTIEVGWFANNYMILMEVTRVGARRGTVLEGDDAIAAWETDPARMAATPFNGTNARRARADACLTPTHNGVRYQGFYNLIGCVMLVSLDPLRLNDTNGEDDIIISAFAIQTFQASDITGSGYGTVPLDRAVVVARYPSNANECVTFTTDRDPFDFYNTGVWDARFVPPPNAPRGAELNGYDTIAGNASAVPPIPADPERYVGFVWLGQHEIPGTPCLGSEFRVDQIETLFNLSGLNLNSQTRGYAPAFGFVLVEMYWEHRLLLGFPAFSPIFRALGDRSVVHVWAAFPVPALEPRIRLD